MTSIKCPRCAHTNPEGSKTCARCNTPLPQVRMQPPASGNPPAQQSQPRQGMHTFRRGQVLAGRYTIVDVVGRGGMGCIYRVHDNTLNEQVALKTLLPQFVSDKLVVERFFNEARIARQLSHPNIVRVHDIGSAENVVYISMEYLKGRSLRGMLDQLPSGQRLPVTTTLHIMIHLCNALEYAHQYTVHRDIKPENVMILEDGTMKLMDFGISKLMTSGNLTATAVIMGTPHYMSPEQLKDSRNVDVRADIYSIGVMLYEILTGNLPTGVPKPASQLMMEVPPALDPIIAKCVEPNPDDRYSSVVELRADLQNVLTLIEEGGSLPEKKPKAAGAGASIPWMRVAGIALVMAILAFAAVGFNGIEKRRQAVIDEAATAVVPAQPQETPGPAESSRNLDEWLRVAKAAQTATARVERTDLVAQGEQLLDAAEKARESDPVKAEQFARHAFEYFLAALPSPDDRFFVPPTESGQDGFYIEIDPVSVAQFAEFCSTVQGGWRTVPIGGEPDAPIVGVTYYDALAYASSHDARLPTADEWQRAYDINSEYMASDIYEWTSSFAASGNANRLPTFGDILVILGASFGESETPSKSAPEQMDYGKSDPNLGFRCVREVPRDPAEAERLLR
ncbi:MAG: protein kinase [Candidatus Hydrogenedentes bacterium]|nr:protein kinase [Candidatus Hydrogenedentota bacterium]